MTNEELALAIQAGQKDLMAELWIQVRKFICMLAGRYFETVKYRGIEVDDLIQAGALALFDAVDKYDPEKGSFLSYLAPHLHRWFRETAGLRTERIARDPIMSLISLDDPLESGGTLADLQADPHSDIEDAEARLYTEQLRACLDAAMKELRPEDAEAIRLRYYDGLTLKQAGERKGVTQDAIRQREQRGLRKLRDRARRTGLQNYVEIRTPYFRRTPFSYTHTSSVEWLAIYREELRERYGGAEAPGTTRTAGGAPQTTQRMEANQYGKSRPGTMTEHTEREARAHDPFAYLRPKHKEI